jgi:hypothetical protein
MNVLVIPDESMVNKLCPFMRTQGRIESQKLYK